MLSHDAGGAPPLCVTALSLHPDFTAGMARADACFIHARRSGLARGARYLVSYTTATQEGASVNLRTFCCLAVVVVGWLLNVPATCECISGTDLHRQFYVLPQ